MEVAATGVNNFSVIYKILSYLDACLDDESPDYTAIQATAFKITEARWLALLEMLAEAGYIKGVEIKLYVHGEKRLTKFQPTITIKGLEYLADNGLIQKVVKTLKDVKEVIPFT